MLGSPGALAPLMDLLYVTRCTFAGVTGGHSYLWSHPHLMALRGARAPSEKVEVI